MFYEPAWLPGEWTAKGRVVVCACVVNVVGMFQTSMLLSRTLHVGLDAVSADKLVAADVNSDAEKLVPRFVFSRGKRTNAFHRGAHVVDCVQYCLLVPKAGELPSCSGLT